MPKLKEIIQTIADDRIASIPTVTEHETIYDHNNLHEQGSDNQDLSGLVVKETGHSLVPDTDIAKLAGLPKITVSANPPETPQTNDIWIQTS